MVGRRAAALALLVLLLAGCGSSTAQRHVALPAGGRAGVVRIGLAHVLWPLDPTHARGRDEVTLARALFATPLRTDPGTGALRPGLCSAWHGAGRTWRFRCRHSGAIAAQLRRAALLPARRIRAADEHTLFISLKAPLPELPYLLTQVAAAPPGVPGPFRLISASPEHVVAERPGLRLDVRRLEPHEALRRFRAGELDEAPVPLGDLRASKLDPQLAPAVRVRRLLAADSWSSTAPFRRRCARSTTPPPIAPTTRRSCPSSRLRPPRASPIAALRRRARR